MQIRVTSQSSCLVGAEGGGAKSGDVAKQKSAATSGSLARLVCCTVHPCPPFGRTWQLLPIYVAVEHGQSHSEAGRIGT